MEDDFFDDANNAGEHLPQNEITYQDSQQPSQQQNQPQQQQNVDDYFYDNQESPYKNKFEQDQQVAMEQSQQNPGFSEMKELPGQNKQDEILRQLEEERNKKLIESQIEESKKQEELLQNAKQWLNEWRQQRQQQMEAKKKINRENEEVLLQAQQKNIEFKSEWDKVVHNVNLKESETTNGKEILRMKQAILGKNSDISHNNQ